MNHKVIPSCAIFSTQEVKLILTKYIKLEQA